MEKLIIALAITCIIGGCNKSEKPSQKVENKIAVTSKKVDSLAVLENKIKNIKTSQSEVVTKKTDKFTGETTIGFDFQPLEIEKGDVSVASYKAYYSNKKGWVFSIYLFSKSPIASSNIIYFLADGDRVSFVVKNVDSALDSGVYTKLFVIMPTRVEFLKMSLAEKLRFKINNNIFRRHPILRDNMIELYKRVYEL